MTQLPGVKKKVRPRWQMLWSPMLFIALGLHGLLIFFPWRSQPSKQPSQEAGKSVKLSRLTTLKAGQSEANQAEIEASLRQANRSDIVVKASPSPSPSPSTLARSPQPSPATRQPAASTPARAVPKAKATPPATVAKESTAVLTQQEQVFVSRLQKLKDREVDDPVTSTLFPSPEYFYKDSGKEMGKPGIVGIEYVSFQRPEEVYQQLVRLYPDYAIAPKPEYGNGLVYEFRKGDFVRYFNLVRAKLGAGTLVILWSRPPAPAT